MGIRGRGIRWVLGFLVSSVLLTGGQNSWANCENLVGTALADCEAALIRVRNSPAVVGSVGCVNAASTAPSAPGTGPIINAAIVAAAAADAAAAAGTGAAAGGGASGARALRAAATARGAGLLRGAGRALVRRLPRDAAAGTGAAADAAAAGRNPETETSTRRPARPGRLPVDAAAVLAAEAREAAARAAARRGAPAATPNSGSGALSN